MIEEIILTDTGRRVVMCTAVCVFTGRACSGYFDASGSCTECGTDPCYLTAARVREFLACDACQRGEHNPDDTRASDWLAWHAGWV